jgi:teichoic acid transport system permease protein
MAGERGELILAEPTGSVDLSPRLTSDEAQALAQRSGLHQMGVRPPLGRYIRSVWGRRSFIWNLSASRAYARNQGSYLGQAWTILKPILDSATFIIIFGFVFKSSGGDLDNRAAFIVIGTFTYALFNASVMGGINSIPTNLALIRSHQFPRAVVPLSTAMTETVLFGPVLAAMVILTLVTGTFPDMNLIVPKWSWLLLPFAAALLAVFSTGLAMFFARLGARTPDIANVVPFLLSLGRFASGVMFFLPDMIGTDSWFRPIFLHQPVQIFLELFRAVFGHEQLIPMTGTLWLEAGAWAIVTFALGFLFFWGAEETYGRD